MFKLTLGTGTALLRKKSYKQVHAEAIKAIHRNVSDPLPYFLLGEIAAQHDNHSKALELLSKACVLGPDVVDYHVHRAKILSTLGRQNAAKQAADVAVNLGTDEEFLLDTLGVVYSRSGYHKDAIPLFEEVVKRNPTVANYHYNLAASAQFIGQFDTARTAYERTIALDPKFYRAWSALISLRKQTAEHNRLETLKALFDAAGDDAEGRLQLGHAIAKTLEDLGQHDESLAWLLRGKRQKRDQLRYDRDAGKKLFDAAKSTVMRAAVPATGQSKTAPLFIIGLPRTGTTLVDRILSSHTDVVSAGELNIFAELIKDVTQTHSNFVMDADTLLRTQGLDLSRVGADYIEKTLERGQGAEHLIDKMPLNFFYAGLIHRALPNARIIALRRGAMDSCLSNFRQLFSTQYSYYNYTFDLGDTAWFYAQFDRLMTHWRQTLPTDRFMEVHYEDIVFDQEIQTRRLLNFCDLDWQEACLNFHENTAPVSTASSVQVRQPLYSGSIGRWKKYGGALDGLKTSLGDLAD